MKKNLLKFFAISLFSIAIITSCKDDDDQIEPTNEIESQALVLNYGAWGASNGEIDVYNANQKTISHNAYAAANNGVSIASNLQSAMIIDKTLYIVSNSGDKIDVVDSHTLQASCNPISNDFKNPRFITANNQKAYVSCYGEADYSVMADSYVAEIDLSTKKVVRKILVAGGCEDLLVAGDNLYVCLGYTNKLAVVNLTNESINYVQLPAAPQHIRQDAQGNLWISVVNTYSTPAPADSLGVVAINPKNNSRLAFVNDAEIGANGLIDIDANHSILYVMNNESFPGNAASISKIDVVTKQITTSKFIEGQNFTGMGFDSKDNKLYILISPSATENGSMQVYDIAGSLLDEQTTGIYPQTIVFAE